MRGHLVIADISGYTRFLTDSELEHANGIITDLLNSVINSIQAPLTVSSIEGDAVFMYGVMPEDMSGQTVLESVELLYAAFAGALETMTLNTTCRCNACVNINTLGMKIVMHCGEFAKSAIGGRETLSGPDVILAHRLLKNRIRDEVGIADYLYVTQACVDDLGVHDMVLGWTPHSEEYEHVGRVSGYVSSLPDVWAYLRQQNENKVVQKEAWLTLGAHSQAPPAVIWDHLIDPIKRTKWLSAHRNDVRGESAGRIAPGSEFHCAHGDDETQVFTVIDMRPVDYITFVTLMEEGKAMRYTDYVIPSGRGTRVVTHAAALFSPDTGETLHEDALAEMAGPIFDTFQPCLDRLAEMADAAAAALVDV